MAAGGSCGGAGGAGGLAAKLVWLGDPFVGEMAALRSGDGVGAAAGTVAFGSEEAVPEK